MNLHGRLASIVPATGSRRIIAQAGRIRNANIALSAYRYRSSSILRPPVSIPASNIMSSHHQTIHTQRCERSLISRRLFSSHSAATNDDNKKRPSTMSTKDFRYCVDLVQNRDRESYLCGLLMPYDARKSFFAIRAWNVELASIKDGSAQKKSTGGDGGPNVAHQVRIQWWWDALNRIYDEDPQQQQYGNKHHASFSLSNTLAASYFKNPIVRVLDCAVHEKQLTRRFLERLSEARETDLHSQQPETMTAMVEHADNIFSSLLYLTLETVDVRDQSVDIVAQHAGIGIGLVTALRGVRMRLIRGECPIPKDLLPPQFPYDKLTYTYNSSISDEDGEEESTKRAANDKENQLNDEERQMLKAAVEQVCILANSHLSQAQELQSDVPKHARTCFLPVIPAMHYLSKLEKAEYDIFDDSLLEHNNMTILALLGRTWLTGVF